MPIPCSYSTIASVIFRDSWLCSTIIHSTNSLSWSRNDWRHTMAKLVIFGAGDIARLAQYYFARDSQHEVVAFTVDRQYRQQHTFLDLPLVDFENIVNLYRPRQFKMFVAV